MKTRRNRINENQKVTLTLGQLKRLVRESDESSSYKNIWTVVLYDLPGTEVSTVSYDHYDDAVKYCMDELKEELDEEDFAECEERAKNLLDDDGYYETGNTQYMIYEARLYSGYNGL